MQIKHIVLLAVVVTGLFSCNALTKKEALKMNNTLVSINNNLYYKGREYGTLLSEAVQTKDFSKLPPCRVSFEKYIDSSRQSVIGMKDVGGSEELRNFEIELLGFEKHMLSGAFSSFERLTTDVTNEQMAALFEVIEKDSKVEEEKMKKFKELQAAYAKKNGFKIEASATVPAAGS